MVSWLIQVFAAEGAATFPGVSLAGGFMLSGGSYACYADPKPPPSHHGASDPPRQPQGSCKGCVEYVSGGCSQTSNPNATSQCSSCDLTAQTFCSYCCPRDWTEAYYEENPSEWASHPPVFLAQTSTVDGHADLCATRNYHKVMQSHGAQSTLVLVAPDDMSCFCVGTPANPDTAGSPWKDKCSEPGWGENCSVFPNSNNCCITHTLGFASMVQPAADFVINAVK